MSLWVHLTVKWRFKREKGQKGVIAAPLSSRQPLGSAWHTWIEVISFTHFDPSTGILLQVGDRLATLANDGPGGHGGHQDLKMQRVPISA